MKRTLPWTAAAFAAMTSVTAPALAADGWLEFGCNEIEETGYQMVDGKMVRQLYEGTQFLFALREADMTAILQLVNNQRFYMDCRIAFRLAPDAVACTDGAHAFVIEKVSGRFTYTRHLGWAYPDVRVPTNANGDPLTVGYGFCIVKGGA